MMKVGSIQSLFNSTPLIKLTPSAIQSLCSIVSNACYTSSIPNPFAQQQYQDAFVQYTQGYNNQRSDVPDLMLTTMLECSRAYAQHFHPLLVGVTYVLQSLHSTHSLITHMLHVLCPTHHKNQSCISFFYTIHHKKIISVYQACAQSHNNKSSISRLIPSTTMIVLFQQGLCPI